MPGIWYVRLAKYIIPMMDGRRSFSGVRVSKAECGYKITNGDKGWWYFASPYNVGRYLFRDPSLSIYQRMVDKYIGSEPLGSSSPVVIDIGANVGEFSHAIAKLGGKVYACEPDPSPYKCLKENSNRYSRVECHQVAFGENESVLPFYLLPMTNDSSFVKPDGPVVDVVEVALTTLDDFFESVVKEKNIDLLKVEAEGFEPEILKGASNVLRSHVDRVVVDGGPERNGRPTSTECAKILESAGFDVTVENFLVRARRDLQ